MAFVQLASDDFNRADSGDLGANWDSGYTGYNALAIASNFARPSVANANAAESYGGIAWPNNQYAEVVFSSWANENAGGILLRMTAAPTFTGYLFYASEFGGTSVATTIYKVVNDTWTSLVTETTTVWASADVLRAEVEGQALRLFRNGGLLLSTSDNTLTSGRVGLYGLYFSGGAGGLLNLDTFVGGEITGSTSTFTYTGTGGITLAGSAAVQKTKVYVPTGGLVLAGNAGVAKTKSYFPSGGIVLAGSAVSQFIGDSPPAGANFITLFRRRRR